MNKVLCSTGALLGKAKDLGDILMRIEHMKDDNNDSYSIAYIHVNSWRAAYIGIIPQEILDNMDIEKRKAYFDKVVKDKSENNVIAFIDNVPAGFLTFGNCRDDDKDNSFGEIRGIYLLPEYWHQGIGSKLINWGINELKVMGFKNICLWVLDDNLQARNFYEKQGFVYEGTSKEIIIGKPLIELRYILQDYFEGSV